MDFDGNCYQLSAEKDVLFDSTLKVVEFNFRP